MAQVLSNLPIGAKVKFGKYSVNGETAQPITWLVVAKNHSTSPLYPTNSVTLLTEKIIDERCVDAKEPSNSFSAYQTGGNARYSLSNIDQWLNKDNGAGEWYVAAHSVDQSPDSTNVSEPVSAAYVNRPAFLHAFSIGEKNLILDTTIGVGKNEHDGGGTENITRKVFLPSAGEISTSYSNYGQGTTWSYFLYNTNLRTTMTETAYNVAPSAYRPATIGGAWRWWTRSVMATSLNAFSAVSEHGDFNAGYSASASLIGIRPALNLSSSSPVSDETDSEGCYVVVANTIPSSPTTLTIPTIYGGKANTISWGSVTDPDGDSVTYQLECSYDGSTFSQIYSGASTAYSHLVTFGTIPMAYRVKATDSAGESSEYVTAAVAMVINNNSPVISGTDGSLGVKDKEFSQAYSITDSDSSEIVVTEAVDGKQIRSFVAVLGSEYSLAVTGNTWLSLPNGVHTMTISASDGIDTSVRTYTFTKSVSSLTIQTKNPMESSTMPTRISIQVTRNIPPDAIFKVEACNNGFDSSPTWEDATSAVTGNAVHLFGNTTKTATKWGVLVRVTVARNGSEGACYISAIGGNFE